MTSTFTPTDDVRAFALAVRAALVDLPTEDVDDLTEGLEADLLERRLDDPDHELGDPLAYATELRHAAGLSDRRVRRLPDFRQEIAELRARPWIAHLLDFLAGLEPAWWVLRAWVLYLPIAFLLGAGPWPNSPFAWVVAGALVVLSVQWGRGHWLPTRALRGVNLALTAAAVVIIPFLIPSVAAANVVYESYPEQLGQQGLSYNGTSIWNIYAYDEHGEPLRDVQLFDQDGNPLVVVSDPNLAWVPVDGQSSAGMWRQYALTPSLRDPGSSGWNVFPLDQTVLPADWYAQPEDQILKPSKRDAAPFPFDRIRPLLGAGDETDDAASASPED